MEQNSGFPKHEILFDKLSELAENVKYMKDVLTTILLTNQIYHLHEFLPVLVLWFCQRIMWVPYMLATYTQVVELKKHGFFMPVLLTHGICLELVPSYSSAAYIRGLSRFFRWRITLSSTLSNNGTNLISETTQEIVCLKILNGILYGLSCLGEEEYMW